MIVDERIITFINSMDTENSEILETIETGSSGGGCTDHPTRDAELPGGSPFDEKTYARSGSRNCRRFLCVIDE